MSRILYKIFAIVTFGFYIHPSATAGECPGHLKNADDFEREQRQRDREYDPMKVHETKEQKDGSDKGDGKWVSKK